MTGEITRIRLVNPHAYVYFDVTDDATTCHMNQITFANGVTATRESIFGDDGTINVEERQIERTDGTPNIDGNWALEAPQERSGARPTATLTDAGLAAVADASPDQNPRFNCLATNIAMDWVFNGMVNSIAQTGTDITMTYGFMDLVRTIHLDGSDMPDDFVPNRAGYSMGEWVDDTLVVTTTGFDEGWIMAPIGGRAGVVPDGAEDADRPERPEDRGGPQSVKNSAELTVTERFTLNDDGTVLTRDYAFIDPLYLEEPFEGSDDVTLTSDAFAPYDCDDLTNERTE